MGKQAKQQGDKVKKLKLNALVLPLKVLARTAINEAQEKESESSNSSVTSDSSKISTEETKHRVNLKPRLATRTNVSSPKSRDSRTIWTK